MRDVIPPPFLSTHPPTLPFSPISLLLASQSPHAQPEPDVPKTQTGHHPTPYPFSHGDVCAESQECHGRIRVAVGCSNVERCGPELQWNREMWGGGGETSGPTPSRACVREERSVCLFPIDRGAAAAATERSAPLSVPLAVIST